MADEFTVPLDSESFHLRDLRIPAGEEMSGSVDEVILFLSKRSPRWLGRVPSQSYEPYFLDEVHLSCSSVQT